MTFLGFLRGVRLPVVTPIIALPLFYLLDKKEAKAINSQNT